ncbi:MAG: hypothetical protein N3A71_04165 [Candidatus Dojkabacteria bacterium]|nr:hypothetical protein [Candidatus Dojkabacteria bacterium]
MHIEEKNLDKIIFVDKPVGITSFDVITMLRKKFCIKKIGHAGTLDPLASGLMICGIGKATKKLINYVGLDKTYLTEIILGFTTPTLDLEMKPKEFQTVDHINQEKVKKVIDDLSGCDIELEVPAYSAKRINGRKLCNIIRKSGSLGEISIPKKLMHIRYLKFISLKDDFFEDHSIKLLSVEMKVSSGSYVRSIASEIGHRLGVDACCKSIRRIAIGEYDINNVPLTSLNI